MGLFSWWGRLFGKKAAIERRARVDSVVTQTWQVDNPSARPVRISYAPRRDGIPDAGEVVWAWVPYEEDPGQGKDRPLLVIARHDAMRVYAVKLTSRQQPASADRVALGAGSWDAQRRDSWADIGRLYSVHHFGIRREAAPLDKKRFTLVAKRMADRHGWQYSA